MSPMKLARIVAPAALVFILNGISSAADWQCSATGGCDYEWYNPGTSKWETRHVPKGSVVVPGEHTHLIGQGWHYVG